MAKKVENSAETTKKPGGVTGKGFMPGVSGNPGGRPKKKPITELYQEMLNDGATIEAIRKAILKSIRGGKTGFVLLVREIADRVEGKVALPVSGPDGGPIEIHHLEKLSNEEFGLLERLIGKITDASGDSGGDDTA
jgi:hypothetical protein